MAVDELSLQLIRLCALAVSIGADGVAAPWLDLYAGGLWCEVWWSPDGLLVFSGVIRGWTRSSA